jgi:hypothetical protein
MHEDKKEKKEGKEPQKLSQRARTRGTYDRIICQKL